MHELSLAQSVIDLIEGAARREQFTRARVVRLEIGALSCVEPEALCLAFECASRGSVAEDARLELLRIDGLGRCRACGHEAFMESLYDPCPSCGEVPLDVLQGTQMRVKDLDVE